jgi:hypothetical protein
MKEDFRDLPMSKNHEINSEGFIRNKNTNQLMKITNNVCAMGLDNGKTTRISPAKWVFRLFFNTIPNDWREWPKNPKYWVSPDGDVRNSESGVLLNPYKQQGYLRLSIDNGSIFVHRIVAECFLPLPSENMSSVNHIDHNPFNNHVSNLEWSNPILQAQHKKTNSKVPKSRILRKVDQVDRNGKIVKTYESAEIAASDNGMKCDIIRNSIQKKHLTQNHYWRYQVSEIINGEIWKCYSTQGRIEVSNMGRVKRNGYLIDFSNNKRKYLPTKVHGKMMLLHVMVARLFVDNPCNYPTVDHLNKDTRDNRAENLEWCTTKEQNIRARAKAIVQWNLGGTRLKEWRVASEAADELDLNANSISNCCYRRTKSYGGWLWSYKLDES